MRILKSFSVALFTLIMFGCTTAPNSLSWKNTQKESYQQDIPENRSSLIVYRTQNAIEGATTNIYVNGEYLASLQPNAYSQTLVCPDSQRLYSEFTHQDPGYRNKANLGAYYSLPQGKISFFKVININGKPSLTPVEESLAKQELESMPRQSHTLSRVDYTNCSVTKHYDLQASTLFPFNKVDYQSMLTVGKQELSKIAMDIQQYGLDIKKIEIIGYSDPMGSEKYNKKLSLQRANTVKQVFVDNGIAEALISVEGKGSENLLVSNCQIQSNNKIQQQLCNQPNR
ncbi:OmpA family protein [Gallibacterium trehalosifermentans]|uniref:OmpA family protein n=1 Tax=Gallibacterium trehalosifermentans TaxID=516935 RepID=A0ABV6H150_9PAST